MNADFQGSIKPKIFFRVYLRKSASNGTKKAEPSLTLPPCKSMPIFVSGPIKGSARSPAKGGSTPPSREAATPLWRSLWLRPVIPTVFYPNEIHLVAKNLFRYEQFRPVHDRLLGDPLSLKPSFRENTNQPVFPSGDSPVKFVHNHFYSPPFPMLPLAIFLNPVFPSIPRIWQIIIIGYGKRSKLRFRFPAAPWNLMNSIPFVIIKLAR